MSPIDAISAGTASSPLSEARELQSRLEAGRRKAENLGKQVREARRETAKSMMDQFAALANDLLFVAQLAAARGDARMTAAAARQAESLLGMAEGLTRGTKVEGEAAPEGLREAAGRLVNRAEAIGKLAERTAAAVEDGELADADRRLERIRTRGQALLDSV